MVSRKRSSKEKDLSFPFHYFFDAMVENNLSQTTQKPSPKKTDLEGKVVRLLTTGSYSQPEIRKKLNLSKQTVYDIVKRILKKKIEEDPAYARKRRGKKYRAIKTPELILANMAESMKQLQKGQQIKKSDNKRVKTNIEILKDKKEIETNIWSVLGSWLLKNMCKRNSPKTFCQEKLINEDDKLSGICAAPLFDVLKMYSLYKEKLLEEVAEEMGKDYKKDEEFRKNFFEVCSKMRVCLERSDIESRQETLFKNSL